jgi:SAM-dependent methyltransferase
MFVKLEPAVRRILRCPLCKGRLDDTESQFARLFCGVVYPQITVGKNRKPEAVFDFRIKWPVYCKSADMKKWSEIQEDYEESDVRRKRRDELKKYLDEIDTVKEIYTKEFSINGFVLDVGGHQGKLRHFLHNSDVPLYVSVDPYAESFADIDSCINLFKTYPSLTQPCNFLACHAENLPFESKIFDWVHMRSVLDHVYDPYRAMVEAYRVLKDGSMILIGLAVTGGQSSLEASQRVCEVYVSPIVRKALRMFKDLGMIKAAKYELKLHSVKPLDDRHVYRWEYEKLLDLLKLAKFSIAKVHWQKPPYTGCVYIAGKKESLEQ